MVDLLQCISCNDLLESNLIQSKPYTNNKTSQDNSSTRRIDICGLLRQFLFLLLILLSGQRINLPIKYKMLIKRMDVDFFSSPAVLVFVDVCMVFHQNIIYRPTKIALFVMKME
jgi:hypothetical protein